MTLDGEEATYDSKTATLKRRKTSYFPMPLPKLNRL
jgi:hypothetical protein